MLVEMTDAGFVAMATNCSFLHSLPGVTFTESMVELSLKTQQYCAIFKLSMYALQEPLAPFVKPNDTLALKPFPCHSADFF
jgi:hypothetical protein